MTLAKLGGKQIGQFDLANLAFDLSIGHRRVDVMLKTRLGQQLHKQLLCQVGISTGGALFDQQAGTSGSSHQRMIADDAVKFSPKAIDVRVTQAIDPATRSGASFCSSAR